MTSRKLLALTLVALLVIAGGVWLATRQYSSVEGERAALYPQLKQQLDAIESVRIFKAGDARTVEIAKTGAVWGVTERAGYPADGGKLGKFLRDLADAKVLEEKTSKAASYAALGVEDLKEQNASGMRVEIAGPSEPVNLILGKTGPRGGSHYVRRAGEAQSWLIDAALDASAAPGEWLRKDIIDVGADRIQSVSVSNNGKVQFTATKSSRADADFAVADLPKGKQVSSPTAANGLASALTAVTLADVQPKSALEGTAPTSHARFTTFDGLVVEIDGWVRDEKRHIAVRTSYDAQVAERFKTPTTQAAPEEKKDAPTSEPAKPAPAATGEDKKPTPEEEATSVAARTNGWIYEIASYKFDQIFKSVDTLT